MMSFELNRVYNSNFKTHPSALAMPSMLKARSAMPVATLQREVTIKGRGFRHSFSVIFHLYQISLRPIGKGGEPGNPSNRDIKRA